VATPGEATRRLVQEKKTFGEHFFSSSAPAGNFSETDGDETDGLVNKKGAPTVLSLAN